MFRLCVPIPLSDLLAGGAILLLGMILLIERDSRSGDHPMDGNERLLRQLAILAAFTVVGFLFFAFAWRPC